MRSICNLHRNEKKGFVHLEYKSYSLMSSTLNCSQHSSHRKMLFFFVSIFFRATVAVESAEIAIEKCSEKKREGNKRSEMSRKKLSNGNRRNAWTIWIKWNGMNCAVFDFFSWNSSIYHIQEWLSLWVWLLYALLLCVDDNSFVSNDF